jgi:GNAT superfamily N-acetyltransferase
VIAGRRNSAGSRDRPASSGEGEGRPSPRRSLKKEDATIIEIRPATADSIRFVVDYCYQCVVEGGDDMPYEELFQGYLDGLQSESYWCFIASSGGQPVGYVDLDVERHEGQDSLWIGELYVVPDRRRQGVGVALVRHALAFAAARGWSKIHATTEPDNPGGLGTLQKAGFVIVSATEDRILLTTRTDPAPPAVSGAAPTSIPATSI